ncbi:transcriptional repressor [Actinobaculum suis]|nr:transcriptional repressor [Actinobaculum suis]OCA95772.1 transcriptional repressor [Actinobaculum suis]
MGTDFTRMLRDAGLRATEPRLAVLREVDKGGHLSAEQLRAGVIEQLGSVSVQAIYDIVHTLTEKGILRKMQPTSNVTIYELNLQDNHHHMICRSCGKIVDVPCPRAAAPCLLPADPRGWEIDEAEITFWGYCPECQEARHAPEE